LALLGDEAEEMAVTRNLVGLGDVPAGEVGAAHVEDLALAHQLLHALPDLLPGRAARDVVHLVEVDVLGLQAPQGRLTLPLERQRVDATEVGPVAHRAIDLGGDDGLLAPAAALGEPPADDLLRRAEVAAALHLSIAIGR